MNSEQLRLSGALSRQVFMQPVWVLKTADGQFQLVGEIDGTLEGATVEVEGVYAEAQFSVAMVGPIVQVERIWRA